MRRGIDTTSLFVIHFVFLTALSGTRELLEGAGRVGVKDIHQDG